MTDQHESPIKTPKQLIIVIVLAFAIPIAIAALFSQLVTGGRKGGGAESPEKLSKLIGPVAHVELAPDAAGATTTGAPAAGTAAAAPAERSGEEIVKAQCVKCHETGEGGAPKIGDKQAWAPRISRGVDVVTKSAIKGHGNMPARGGMADLTDAELTKAFLYMFNQSGAAPAASPATAAAGPATSGANPATPAVTPAATPVAAADGKSVYEKTCVACHATGVAGAPKLGDKAAWGPRIATGKDALLKSALGGKNAMPPKGGNAALSDADIKAAIDYMVAQAK